MVLVGYYHAMTYGEAMGKHWSLLDEEYVLSLTPNKIIFARNELGVGWGKTAGRLLHLWRTW